MNCSGTDVMREPLKATNMDDRVTGDEGRETEDGVRMTYASVWITNRYRFVEHI